MGAWRLIRLACLLIAALLGIAYSGPHVRGQAVAEPETRSMRLGALGPGWIEWRGADGFGRWAITGNSSHPAPPQPASFAALWTEADGKTNARTLRSSEPLGLPHAVRLETGGHFPFATLSLRDDDLPVAVTMRSFAPLIPADTDGSSLPVALFVFTVRNVSRGVAKASIALSVASLLGVGGAPGLGAFSDRSSVVAEPFAAAGGVAGVAFVGPSLRDQAVRDLRMFNARGSMALLARFPTPEAEISACTWNALDGSPPWWIGFEREGRVSGATGVGAEGRVHPAGCVALRVQLQPNETRDLAFAIGWHCPRAYEADGTEIIAPYALRFSDAAGVARHALDEITALTALSEEWQAALMRSSAGRLALPGLAGALQDVVTATTLRVRPGDTAGKPARALVVESDGRSDLLPLSRRVEAQSALLALWPTVDRGDIEYRLGLAARGTDAAVAHSVGDIARLAAEHVRHTGDQRWLTGIWPTLQTMVRAAVPADGASELARAEVAASLDLATRANDPETARACMRALARSPASAPGPTDAGPWARWRDLLGCDFASDREELKLAPREAGVRLSGPVFAPQYWAWFEWRTLPTRTIVEFRLDRLVGGPLTAQPTGLPVAARGPCTIRKALLRPAGAVHHTDVRAWVGRSPAACNVAVRADGTIEVAFEPPVTLGPGDRLSLEALRAPGP
jgi:hypothetical protein